MVCALREKEKGRDGTRTERGGEGKGLGRDGEGMVRAQREEEKGRDGACTAHGVNRQHKLQNCVADKQCNLGEQASGGADSKQLTVRLQKQTRNTNNRNKQKVKEEGRGERLVVLWWCSLRGQVPFGCAPPCNDAAAALEGTDAKGLGGVQGCCGESL
eukprot:3004783-Rhodomonas_salina.2